MRILLILVLISFWSCKKETPIKARIFESVEIETVLEDSTLNSRAIEISDVIMYASSNGRIGPIFENYQNITGNLNEIFYSNRNNQMKDSVYLNFRSLAFTQRYIFALSIGSPTTLIRKTGDSNHEIVYQENHPKAFYDAMDFWNDQEGIAIGDPTDTCMSVIITRDGGNTWTKLLCDQLPKAKEGEAAFAASDTNIAIVGDHTWVATGGKASRILYSPDKGNTWEVFNTPIVQGLETTGMYSLDFYDALNGFAIGGDYTKPEDNESNKIRTQDGGKTWSVVAKGQGPGYRSCVQYVPNGKGKELVALGFKGIDYSNDSGTTWTHLSDEGFYTIRFLNDSTAYAAGKGRISKLIFK